MIKYFDVDSYDENGFNIIPVSPKSPLVKTAGSYSPEIMSAIMGLNREPQYYYVVINAVGAFNVWGANKNGDGFTEEGLRHVSTEADAGTDNDYGYKTFERYAKLFKHHVNKADSPSYGKVFFSHWNDKLKRVELVVGIDVSAGADIIQALEQQEPVSVSMGCFTDPNYPIATMYGYKKISDIIPGDMVCTSEGRFRKVTSLNRRKYTGGVSTLSFRGLSLKMQLTDNHPLMAKVFSAESKGKSRPYIHDSEFEDVDFEWTHAGHLEKGDHIKLVTPDYSDEFFPDIDDENLAKLLGYYLGDGCFGYNGDKACTTQFTFNLANPGLRDIPKFLSENFDDVKCSIRAHKTSKKCVTLEVYSTDISEFIRKMCGVRSKEKFIPPEIMKSKEKIKLAFVGAWLSCDGFTDNKGVHISSANEFVLMQARDLLVSIGINPSIYKIEHKAGSGFNYHDTTEYTLNISHFDSVRIAPYSDNKLGNINDYIKDRVKKGSQCIRSNSDGTKSYSISNVEKDIVEDVDVYNFEVEEDESYLAAGLVSHNCRVKQDICSICNNAASTRAQYCKHLKNFMRHIVSADTAKKWSVELGRIIVPGSLVYAINDKPKFFDISRVHVGADRTAFILGKAASTSHPSGLDLAEAYGVTEAIADAMEKRARVIKISQMKKRSEIDKEIDGDAFEITKSDAIKKALGSKMTALAESEPRLPADVLNRIAMSGSLDKIFSNMLGIGVHPKPVEFQRIVLVNIGERDLADQLEASRTVFDHSCDCGHHEFNIGEPDDDFILKSLLPYLKDRSAAIPLLIQRAGNPMLKTASVMEAMVNLKGEVAKSLASMFAGLKMKAAGASVQTTASLFTKKPWLAPLIGGGVYATLMRVISEADKNDSTLIPAHAYSGTLTPSFAKSASVTNATGLGLAAGALAYPAAYVMNSYNQKSLYEKGVPLFSGAGTDPKTSAILAGGGTFLGTLLTDRIGRKLIKA